MSLTFKDYKINHIAFLTLSQKQVKIQNSMPSIGRTYYSIDRKMKKFITKVLPRSIDSRFLFDWSKSTFNRSKGILDRLRQWRISLWSFCLTQSVLDSSSINRKVHSIDRNSQKLNFSEFSSNHFWHLHYSSIKNTFFIMEFLLDSIGSRFLFDQLKGTFNRSKGILDQSKLVKIEFFRIFW